LLMWHGPPLGFGLCILCGPGSSGGDLLRLLRQMVKLVLSRNPNHLNLRNQQIRRQHEKAAVEAGLPPNVGAERRIANCDFHIFDLLRLAGKGSVIEGKDFENCTIRGPGIITTSAPPRPPKKGSGITAVGSTFHTPTLYVEGDPESVLHEVPPDGASGVIHLVGCTYRRVTFKDIGIAGLSRELEWWRENVRFSGSNSVGLPRSQARIETEEDRRRAHIKNWRDYFENFNYAEENILETGMYSQISPYLQEEIRERLQNRREMHLEIDNRTGGEVLIRGQSPSSVKTLLLDEVTRLEQEWELI
jgi:hypothetical protein